MLKRQAIDCLLNSSPQQLGISRTNLMSIISTSTFRISDLLTLEKLKLLCPLIDGSDYSVQVYEGDNMESCLHIFEHHMPYAMEFNTNYNGPLIRCGSVYIYEQYSVNVAPIRVHQHNRKLISDLASPACIISNNSVIDALMVEYTGTLMKNPKSLVEVTKFGKVWLNICHPEYRAEMEYFDGKSWLRDNWKILAKFGLIKI